MPNPPFRSAAGADPAAPDLDEFADLARRIASLDATPASQIRAELKQRLRDQQRRGQIGVPTMIAQRLRRHPARALALACALALALTLGFAPARAALASVLQQFGLIRVTAEPTLAEQLDGQPMAAPPAASDPTPTLVPAPAVLSVAAASQSFGGAVYAPAALPAGFSLQAREAHSGSAAASVVTFYTNPAIMLDTGPAFINLRQASGAPTQASDLGVGDAPTTAVTVRGQPGLWVDQAALMFKDDGTGHMTPAGINVLLWSEGANTFVLESNHLGQAELLQIAESLK